MPTTTSARVSPAEVGQAFFELHHQLHRLSDQRFGTCGLSLARAKVLMRLAECGSMNHAALAARLGVAARTVTDAVDALERDGLVVRTEDPADRRARIVSLTEQGREAHATAQVVRLQTMKDTFGRLSAAERSELSDLLGKLRSYLPTGDNGCE